MNARKEISRDQERDGRSCPPSSLSYRNCGNTKKKLLSLSDYFNFSSPSSGSKCSGGGSRSFGGDEEEEIGTRLSSRSFSPEYSSSKYYDNNNGNVIKNKIKKKENAAAVKVDRGVAVVEQSSDPYGDFRRSMVEMIMARRRLRDGDLNRLLRSYLLLNPPQHHPVILKAFTDLYMGSSIEQHLIS